MMGRVQSGIQSASSCTTEGRKIILRVRVFKKSKIEKLLPFSYSLEHWHSDIVLARQRDILGSISQGSNDVVHDSANFAKYFLPLLPVV